MREKLIELIGRVQDDGCDYTECFSQWDRPNHIENSVLADYLIANGVTIQKWIPVSERLPVHGKCVLIYSDTGKVAEGQYTVTQNWVQFRWSATKVNVTHWMPLPEPPKEGE